MKKSPSIKKILFLLTILFIFALYLGNCSNANYPQSFTPVPATPILYQAVIIGSGVVGLSWSEPTSTSGITYNIYATTNVNVPLQKVASATTGSGFVKGLIINTIYWFAVRAVNNGGVSQFSNMISMTTWPAYTIPAEPMAIAIDANNNVWVASAGVSYKGSYNSYLTGLTQTGTILGNYSIGNNQTVTPGKIAIDAQGYLLITNWGGNYIMKINQTGQIVGQYTVNNNPYGIAIDHSGNIWVNNANNVVTNLTSSGSIIGNYLGGGFLGGIAIDANGNVWAVNYENNTVTALTPTGSVIGTYPVGNQPTSIAIDPQGNVWVVNNGDNTVTALTPTGSVIGTYPVGNQPTGVAIDANGNVWVANSGDATVMELNPTGTVINIINTYAYYIPGTGQFLGSIAIDAFGNVWVIPPLIVSNFVVELTGVATGPQFFPYSGPQWP